MGFDWYVDQQQIIFFEDSIKIYLLSYTHKIISKAIFTENFFYNAWNLQSLQSVTTGSSLHMSVANLLVFFINNSTKYKNAVF